MNHLDPVRHVRGESQEISPIFDVRGTADYKRLLLRQLLFAHFLKFAPTLNPGELIQG